MSFRDELSNLTPTQEQIQAKAVSQAQKDAQSDYYNLKESLKFKAKHNQYITTANGDKYISCYYPDSYYGEPEAANYIKRECEEVRRTTGGGFFSKPRTETSYTVYYRVTDQTGYDEYIKELHRLAAQDDIHVSIVGYCKTERQQEVSIPGYVGSSVIASSYVYRIKLSVSITF